MQHAYYSVISPEGCAAILWKSGEHAPKAANALRLTPTDLSRLNLIDTIVPEPLGGAHRDPEVAIRNVEAWIKTSLRDLKRFKLETLLKKRYDRLRNYGSCFESTGDSAKTTKTAKPRTRRRAAQTQETTPAQS